MASRRTIKTKETQLAFEALSIEGSLLSPEWLSKVAQLSAGSQTEADYRVPKGLNLRDEIGRYWRIAQAHWKDFAADSAAKADAVVVAERFLTALLKQSFGFESLVKVDPVVLSERCYPLGYSALGQRVPVVIAPAGLGVDTLSPAFGDDGRRRSPFGLAQEYLNAFEGALWGIVTDGHILRIVRDNASLTRPAWIEADLERIFTEERYADFAALWLLLHETRFGRDGQAVTECALETWRNAGKEEGTRAREHLRIGVEDALVALGQGFLSHPENKTLRAALQDGSLSTRDYFNQLLRLVYRLIFLLTVEERNLLHPEGTPDPARSLYADGYSLRRLRERALKRSAHDRFADLWQSTKVAFRGLASGEPSLGLPALAGIFASNQCPALDAAKLENRALLLAVFKLAWLRENGALARVNWRDMGPEELGSVYESLLELVPQISKEGRQFGFATGDETKGNARKTTGSYYTPDSLVQVLLDSALEPVIADRIRDAERVAAKLRELASKDQGTKGFDAAIYDKIISGSARVAKGHGPGGTVLSCDEDLSPGRTLRHDIADPQSGNLDSSEHSRGMGPGNDRRVRPVSEDSSGKCEGTRDASAAVSTSGTPETGKGGSSSRSGNRNLPDDDFPDWFLEAQAKLKTLPPDSLAPHSLDSLLAQQALLSLSIVDPACGSGHFLLAAARRLASHVARLQANGTPSGSQYRHALRQVVGHCIYGVDLNPMAVELCKVSLWMEAVEPGLPLTFLNSHIQHGNALLGTTPELMAKGIPDAAWEPIEGDDRKVASALKKRNKQGATGQRSLDTLWSQPADTGAAAVAKAVSELDAASDADATQLAKKEAKWENILGSDEYQKQKFVADAWCAAFVWPKNSGPLAEVAPTNELWRQIKDGQGKPPALTESTVTNLAAQYRFFHWDLQFPQVFAKGGFDVVLGNPPWGSSISDRESAFYGFRWSRIIVRMPDSFIYFARLMFELLRAAGQLGAVLPDGALYQTDCELLRKSLLEDGEVILVMNAGNVFQGVNRPAALLSAGFSKRNLPVRCADRTHGESTVWFELTQSQLNDFPGTVFSVTSREAHSILEKVRAKPHTTLEELIDSDGIQRGVSPDLKEAFLVDDDAIGSFCIEPSHIKPVLTGGRDIKRFSAVSSRHKLIYTSRNDDFENLPGIRSFIDTFNEKISCAEVKQGKHPIYALHRARDERIFLKPEKIVGVITEDEIVVSVDTKRSYATDAVYLFTPKPTIDIYFLTGLLNSRAFSFIYRLYSPEQGRAFAQVKPTVLRLLPIPKVNESNADLASQIAMISRSLHENRDGGQQLLGRLDDLVAHLLSLSPAERALVETSPK